MNTCNCLIMLLFGKKELSGYTADWTEPIAGQIVKCRAWFHIAFRIPPFRVVDVAADGAAILRFRVFYGHCPVLLIST